MLVTKKKILEFECYSEPHECHVINYYYKPTAL